MTAQGRTFDQARGASIQIAWWLAEDGTEGCVFCLRMHPWEDFRHCAGCDVTLCCFCGDRPEFDGAHLCPDCLASEKEAG